MRITGWRDRAARWFLTLIVGRRVAFWISDEAENTINDFGPLGVAGAGAAIVMANALDDMDANTATFSLTGFEIKIRRTDAGE